MTDHEFKVVQALDCARTGTIATRLMAFKVASNLLATIWYIQQIFISQIMFN